MTYRESSRVSWLLGVVFVFVACAEGTKLNDQGSGGDSGEAASDASGGRGTGGSDREDSGGLGSSFGGNRGGTANLGGSAISYGGSLLAGGGSSVSGSSANGGVNSGDAGGTNNTPAPVDGIGIYFDPTGSAPNSVALNLKIENSGSTDVDLATLTVKFWYTDDGWAAPVLDVDYVSLAGVAITSTVDTVDLPGADRVLEISFGSGTLSTNGVLEVRGRLHNDPYLEQSTDNDYSYLAKGYNEHITAYVDSVLVWGVEPGTDVTGVGGAGGQGGEAGTAGSADLGGEAGSAGEATAGTAGQGAGPAAGSSGEAGSSGAAGSTSESGGGSAGAAGADAGGTSSQGGSVDSGGAAGMDAGTSGADASAGGP